MERKKQIKKERLQNKKACEEENNSNNVNGAGDDVYVDDYDGIGVCYRGKEEKIKNLGN